MAALASWKNLAWRRISVQTQLKKNKKKHKIAKKKNQGHHFVFEMVKPIRLSTDPIRFTRTLEHENLSTVCESHRFLKRWTSVQIAGEKRALP